MSNEQPSHEASWATQLDELDKVPGAGFNKERAWNTLYQRLQPKSKPVFFFWRWSAAAILLLLLTVPVMLRLLTTPPVGRGQHTVGATARVSSPSRVTHPADATASVNAAPAALTNKEGRRLVKWNLPPHILRLHRPVAAISAGGPRSNGPGAEIAHNSLTPIDSPSAITALLPVKKKLMTVYINELGDPLEELPVTARSTVDHHFQLKLAGEAVFGNLQGGSPTGGLIMLSKNTSPN